MVYPEIWENVVQLHGLGLIIKGKGNFVSSLNLNGWVNKNSNKYHYVDGKVHNDNEPAEIRGNGTILYYCHGLLHRTDGPAMIAINGTIKYAINGRYHRQDGPAITWGLSEAKEEYWLNGILQKIVYNDGIITHYKSPFPPDDVRTLDLLKPYYLHEPYRPLEYYYIVNYYDIPLSFN